MKEKERKKKKRHLIRGSVREKVQEKSCFLRNRCKNSPREDDVCLAVLQKEKKKKKRKKKKFEILHVSI